MTDARKRQITETVSYHNLQTCCNFDLPTSFLLTTLNYFSSSFYHDQLSHSLISYLSLYSPVLNGWHFQSFTPSACFGWILTLSFFLHLSPILLSVRPYFCLSHFLHLFVHFSNSHSLANLNSISREGTRDRGVKDNQKLHEDNTAIWGSILATKLASNI